MGMPRLLIPDWIASELEAGRTHLQPMLDSAPFDRAAVRTVAGSGDFQIIDGHVRRVEPPSPSTWFPQLDPALAPAGEGCWSLPVTVTEEMFADAAVAVPRALGALIQLHRHGHRSLSSRLGPQAAMMDEVEVSVGSITRFLVDLGAAVGDTVHLHVDRARNFDVTR
ncbi:hypothetical protein CETAM_09925 [Corynebacterium comes]|uniref:Uncharacterized protein n=2 Tax=Corynebacterium comes TaxID=2675218 RepID=A0A6B8VV56_9CORY|nr:hypothetical protein CETAM_09925 [Corynebacterium comes]